MVMLKDILSDIVSIDDVLMIVKSNGATSEMRSNSLNISHATCMLIMI